MTEAPSTDSPKLQRGWPPRFWWLKRLAAAGLMLLVCLVGFHVWLNWHAERRLDRIVGAWRADPEAPLPEMLLLAPGPPTGEDNAAAHYDRAITALPALTQRQRDDWYLTDDRQWPVLPTKEPLLREIITAAQPQLEMARHARSLVRLDWNLPAIDVNLTANWTGIRALADRQRWAMFLCHYDGDIAQTIEYGADMHRLGTASASCGPSLVSGLISSGIQTMAANQLIQTAWHRPPGMSEQDERAAWRAAAPHARQAIAQLLDEPGGHEILILSWKGERVVTRSILSAPGVWPAAPLTPWTTLLAPAFKSDVARLLEREDRVIAAAETRDPAKILDASAPAAPARTMAGAAASFASETTWGSMQRPIITSLQTIAFNRAAAVVLAAKLYHADHGHWPESLEVMIPEYLPHLPVDPFAPNSSPMRFRSDTPVPMVYSVGENLTDDGGSTISKSGLRSDGIDPREDRQDPIERMDLVFVLSLPAEAAENVQEFNIWNWLISPQREMHRLEKLKSETQGHLERERDGAEASDEG